ncbi:MAG: hypothetical protein MUC50_22170 [Myxococcota bacterium]|nr:hypothetical protein [Myxococcota bacterium]
MTVSKLHLLHQGPVIRSLAHTVFSSVAHAMEKGTSTPPQTPGPETSEVLQPRPPNLIRDYIRHVGGDPSWYRNCLPPHMFPQWGFPIMAKTLRGLSYNLVKVLNAGCRIEIHGPLPADQPLHLKANLEDVKDDGKKALLTQRLVTGTAECPELIVAYVTAVVPLEKKNGSGNSSKKDTKERPRVPFDAREIDRFRLRADVGVDYGLVTGDVNPIHWLSLYARLSGFKRPILHGFSALARTVESLNRALWSGDVSLLKSIDIRFVRPLVLPADLGVYIDGQGAVFMGEAPGTTAYLAGSYSSHNKENF